MYAVSLFALAERVFVVEKWQFVEKIFLLEIEVISLPPIYVCIYTQMSKKWKFNQLQNRYDDEKSLQQTIYRIVRGGKREGLCTKRF